MTPDRDPMDLSHLAAIDRQESFDRLWRANVVLAIVAFCEGVGLAYFLLRG